MAMASPVKPESLVSIIIDNYNYGRFLGEAIDSALDQTYSPVEVIVVDDGSTDHSREIIESYGDRIIAIFKSNGGQASAFNTGVKACRGDFICFLDADDVFNSNKVAECIQVLTEKKQANPLVMVYHLLEFVDKEGNSLNRFEPPAVWNYPANLYEQTCKYRHFPYPAAPTSANVFTYELLAAIFPIPERGKNYVIKSSAENIVVRAAGLIGEIYGINQALAKYRSHGENLWHGTGWDVAKFEDFTIARDSFLNRKLEAFNKKPVVSYFDSMESKYHYQKLGDYGEVLKLAMRVAKWRLNLESIVFLSRALIQYFLWLIYPKLVQVKGTKKA
jgi:glycosyltransferase involved in cell wall biosynthesis